MKPGAERRGIHAAAGAVDHDADVTGFDVRDRRGREPDCADDESESRARLSGHRLRLRTPSAPICEMRSPIELPI